MICNDEHQIAQVLAPAADRFNGNPATAAVNTKLYGHVSFVIALGAGTTGTAKIQVEECSAANGTGNVAIPFRYRAADSGDAYGSLTVASASEGFTTAAGSDKTYVIDIDSRELSDTKPFVRLKITEVVDAPVAAAVVALGFMARYKEQPLPTLLA